MKYEIMADLINRNEKFFECGQDRPFSASDMKVRLGGCKDVGLTVEQFVFVQYAKGSGFRSSVDLRPEDIITTTQLAFRLKHQPANAVTKLMELNGVGLPIASAILAWTYPDDFAVIDKRVQQSLVNADWTEDYLLPIPGHIVPTKRLLWGKRYEQFLSHIVEIAKLVSKTPQQIDVWLYNFAKSKSPKSNSSWDWNLS